MAIGVLLTSSACSSIVRLLPCTLRRSHVSFTVLQPSRMFEVQIPAYFAGKSVLVTGATGSVGKALVEKLLRSCPDIRNIYLIIRPRKGEMPQERWTKTLNSTLFVKLKTERPDVFNKVIILQGDNVLDKYGLRPEDFKVLEDNVNIIYHVAATVNFAEELTKAVLTNMKSTYSLCEMAKNMKHLESFVHISTAYCNAHLDNGTTKEVISPSPMDWKSLIAVAENPKYFYELSALQLRLMCGHWTTYTLTKAMAENIVDSYSQFYPTAIMRVALVVGSQLEPEPGWTDTINVLEGICVGVRSGVIRTCLADSNAQAPQIHLDICIRSLVIAPWYLHCQNTRSRAEIFCCRMSQKNTFSYNDLKNMGSEVIRNYPWRFSLYYPFIMFTTREVMFKITFILLHFFPGLIVDQLLKYTGRKPRLLKIYRRYWKVAPFMKANLKLKLDFSREKYLELSKSLLKEDEVDFSLDEGNFLDKMTFFEHTSISVFTEMSNGKEKLDAKSMAASRRRLAWQRITHIVVVICLGLLMASLTSFVYKRSTLMMSLGTAPLAVLYCVNAIFTAFVLKESVVI